MKQKLVPEQMKNMNVAWPEKEAWYIELIAQKLS